jgi:hypothetical protein
MDDPSEVRDFNGKRRRDKRRHVEAAVQRLIFHYELAPQVAQTLSDGIYGLYRDLVAQKLFDDQDQQYRKMRRLAERKLALRTATASGTRVSAYVTDARAFAARMIRLETLECRNLGRGRAIEQASKATWDELSPQERQKARSYLAGNVLSGEKTRRSVREVEFLTSVASLIRQITKSSISFSSAAPGQRQPSGGRHHGVEFDVMMAAAAMADYPLTNEAMARRIQRIRQQ